MIEFFGEKEINNKGENKAKTKSEDIIVSCN
jgi:hypothetical protein